MFLDVNTMGGVLDATTIAQVGQDNYLVECFKAVMTSASHGPLQIPQSVLCLSTVRLIGGVHVKFEVTRTPKHLKLEPFSMGSLH